VVKRLWARLLGRGLVEPVDEMDAPSWNPDLLNWLAEDLVAHDYDLKHTLATILTSRAYQRPAVAGLDGPDQHFVFSGPLARRMTAEQFRDAVASLTGVGYPTPAAQVNWLEGQPAELRQRWQADLGVVTSGESMGTNSKPRFVWIGRTFVIKEPAVPQAFAVLAANEEFTLMINTNTVGSARKANQPILVDFKSHLHPGTNTLLFKMEEKPEKSEPEKDKDKDKNAAQEKPASPPLPPPKVVAAYLSILQDRLPFTCKADAEWRYFIGPTNAQPDLASLTDWKPVLLAGSSHETNWLDSSAFISMAASIDSFGLFRACWVAADPLAVALGRPNREQVATTRPSQATTLQSLELTNGGTLAGVLHQGAEKLLQEHPGAPMRLTELIFQRGLGRAPNRKEAALVKELMGTSTPAAALEDLLWSVAMLPEFQMIY
jgi:hypothetical protein